MLYAPAIALEELISHKNQKRLTSVLLLAGCVSLGGFVYFSVVKKVPTPELVFAAGAISASTLLAFSMLRMFHGSYYFRGFSPDQQTVSYLRGMAYEVARILQTGSDDVAARFYSSHQGYALFMRLGIAPDQVRTYLSGPRKRLKISDLELPQDHFITFSDLAQAIFAVDSMLGEMLQEAGVTKEHFDNSLSWVTRTYYQYKQTQRWWAKDQLQKKGSIGGDWSYGYSYLLGKFSRPLSNNSIFSNLITETDYAAEKVAELETTLTRSREANALLVGDPGVGKMDILQQVAERIRRQTAPAELQGKKLIVLDSDLLLARFDTKQELERTFIALLQQAAQAGNVIMVIENITGFIRAGASLGVDIPALIEPYFGAPELNLIFTADPGSYHHEFERLAIRQKLEVLFIDPPNLVGTEKLLQDISREHEKRYGVWLTYLALRAIASSADRYIVAGVMPDKAVDLLVEVLAAANTNGIGLVTEDFVQTFVSKKTGIPVGPIQDEEREILLDLEGRLHERVVGQEAAITAISSAMRRARAGIQAGDRPLGSFMFLGPTGVGKTETAKALAHVFFGSEANMQRIDMSEYSSPESFERLLGTPTSSGVLSDIMQEHPYAVVLLDEFEKATQQVHDLFLQILDEGRYTDARGTTVNMRNTIIIATSNAGSQFILEAVKDGRSLATEKETIVDVIIQNGIYRPELLNRFDGIILFEPLKRDEQRTVAGFLLDELKERLQDQGYQLQLDSSVMDVLVEAGYSPEFGARPMRRVLQDQIEEAIAKKIIAGNVKKGDTITIAQQDLAGISRTTQSAVE